MVLPYVETAARHGLAAGYQGMFRPQDPISRSELGVMLARILWDCEEMETYGDFLASLAEQPQDMQDVPDWVEEAVRAVHGSGLMIGDDRGLFDPTGMATRAQAAMVVFRSMERVGSRVVKKRLCGEVDWSDLEGGHFQLLTCPAGGGPPTYVLIPHDGRVQALLEDALGRTVIIHALYQDEMSMHMTGPVLTVLKVE